jgi:hypothetical protein
MQGNPEGGAGDGDAAEQLPAVALGVGVGRRQMRSSDVHRLNGRACSGLTLSEDAFRSRNPRSSAYAAAEGLL